MFGNLFGSKIEKDLKALRASTPELAVSYKDGETITASVLMQVNSKAIAILGFPGKLRSKELRITFLANGAWFDSVITGTGKDKMENTLFFCKLPEKLNPPREKLERYMIYPNGKAKVVVSTNRGEKSVTVPLYEISSFGVVLANKSSIHMPIGAKLYQAMLTVGSNSAELANMQVAYVRTREVNGEKIPLVSCVFQTKPRGHAAMLGTAKGLAPKPKPKPKK